MVLRLGRSHEEGQDYPLQYSGEFHGLYSPWGRKGTGLSEFHFHFHFSYNFLALSFYLFFPIFLFSLLHSHLLLLEIDNFMPLLPHYTLIADAPLTAIAIHSKQELVVIEQKTTH